MQLAVLRAAVAACTTAVAEPGTVRSLALRSPRPTQRSSRARDVSNCGIIVVGFDDSTSSQHALVYAAGVAGRIHAHLIVAFVGGAETRALAPLDADGSVMFGDENKADPQLIVSDILLDVRVEWEFVSLYGDVVVELDRLAVTTRADALVLGRSRSPVRRVLGSVPARLVRRTDRPVTVVP
jgi:nucleotide-binding universal stress UspA family protein